MEKKTAIIIGGSGLVGNELLRQLIKNEDYGTIKVFGRQTNLVYNPKVEQYQVDFSKIVDFQHSIKGDELFSCLGTTLKKAGSKENQYLVDYTFQYDFAKIASENGVHKYFLVSSIGANEKSKLFYIRIKGQLDRAVSLLNFDSINIFRPAALDGKRKERRKKEEISIKMSDFFARFLPFFRKYRPIHAKIVAKAMIKSANEAVIDKVRFFTAEQIFEKAGIDYKKSRVVIDF
jgi:uncharacterized protein YbjT (DUF2867 family)